MSFITELTINGHSIIVDDLGPDEQTVMTGEDTFAVVRPIQVIAWTAAASIQSGDFSDENLFVATFGGRRISGLYDLNAREVIEWAVGDRYI